MTGAPGHVFALARANSQVGSAVAALGYPRGLPLSFTQGFVTKKLEDSSTPTLAANMGIEGGNSGGPIIDRSGDVVSVVSRIVVWATGAPGTTTTAALSSHAGGENRPGATCAARIPTAASPTVRARSPPQRSPRSSSS